MLRNEAHQSRLIRFPSVSTSCGPAIFLVEKKYSEERLRTVLECLRLVMLLSRYTE
ncbi:hypothetical protein ACCAA_920037 [Candidatus Accumulibacter aalborgensis]|uniref:Uncharacterized protein n=1 Tax=Candidatus Accumulibacter aalborgensis TaxID=1860102 RepID=A0A1A8Y1L4_9PROT|nr:hypothetical protein ACCAA_920037 [Candidatus Accumulibacter aalborgensis]